VYGVLDVVSGKYPVAGKPLGLQPGIDACHRVDGEYTRGEGR
jgi:hypothetical protein